MVIRRLEFKEPIPSNSKILIFGANGMLGRDVVAHLQNQNLICPSSKECDIADWNAVEKLFRKLRTVDAVINCAAYTQVDRCEDNSNIAFLVNATASQIVAKSAERIKTRLVHISTDYVFEGNKDIYTIADIPRNPNTIYGKSKLLAEQYIQTISSRYFIVRTAWLYGKHGKNFVKTVLNLSLKEGPLTIVGDQFGCPTYTADLAKTITNLIGSEAYGIHHASGEGSCSWYDFAKKILEIRKIDKEIIPISTRKSFDLFPNIKAKRPQFSRLKNTLPMRHWEEALRDFLANEDNLV